MIIRKANCILLSYVLKIMQNPLPLHLFFLSCASICIWGMVALVGHDGSLSANSDLQLLENVTKAPNRPT